MNDEGVRRASELRAATVQIGSIAAAEQGLRDKQLNDETEKARGELGKKEKSVKSKNESPTDLKKSPLSCGDFIYF